MSNTPEVWKAVPGHEGRYEVSDLGRVRTVDHWSRNGAGPFLRKGRLLKPAVRKDGRLYIDFRLRSNGTRQGGGGRKRTVYSLVMEAFVGPRPEGMEILHANDDPSDNRLCNLRYGTRSENIEDAIRNGVNGYTKRTHCPQNHEYTPDNTYTGKRGNGRTFRICKICHMKRTTEARRRRRLAA